jgi:hypothetical protein
VIYYYNKNNAIFFSTYHVTGKNVYTGLTNFGVYLLNLYSIEFSLTTKKKASIKLLRLSSKFV